jgi:putative ATP-dependent endonuclease of the OLD family
MKILNLTLTNFKKIASNKVIEFNDDVNVLVGSNNTGKTSILQALALAFNLPIANFDQNDCVNYLVKDGVCEIEVEFLFDEREWEICFALIKHRYPQENFLEFPKKLIQQKIKQKIIFNVVQSKIEGQAKRQTVLSQDKNKLAQKKEKIIQKALQERAYDNFKNFFEALLFIDSARPKLKRKEAFRPIQLIRRDSNLEEIRGKLYATKKDNPLVFHTIKQHILNVFPEIEDFFIKHNEEKGNFSLKIKEKLKKNGDFENVNYDIHNTGLGMQSLILLIANIFVQDTDIVLLDEPEIHMHPSLVKRFISIIQQISSQKQIILTTHSVPLINSVKPEKILSLKYFPEEKGIIVNHIKQKKEILNVLNEIGFEFDNDLFQDGPKSKTVVFVEGKSDRKYLLTFAKKFKNDLGIDDNFIEPMVIDMEGCGDAFKYATVIKKLRDIDTKFIIVLDKDEKEEEYEKLQEELKENELHIWNKREIENYLLDIKAISKLLNKDESNLKNKLIKIIESQKEICYQRFIREKFTGWKLTKGMRELLKDNLSKDFENYVGEVEKLVVNNLIDIKIQIGREIKNFEKYFDKKWEKEKWDICDGKKVLTNFKRKMNYSFDSEEIIEKMTRCPEDIKIFWQKVIC